MSEKGITITFSPLSIAKLLAFVALILVITNVAMQVLRYILGHPIVFGLVDQFDLNGEGNFPAYFSGLLLLGASALLGVIAKGSSTSDYRRHWVFLALVFLYLSVDELTRFHELISHNIARLANVRGVGKSYLWVAPFALLLIVLALSYLRFFWHLSSRYQKLFLLSGGLYIGGAAGLELVAAWHALRYDIYNFTHAMLYTTEETLEMGGIILFIYTLLLYLEEQIQRVHVDFKSK